MENYQGQIGNCQMSPRVTKINLTKINSRQKTHTPLIVRRKPMQSRLMT